MNKPFVLVISGPTAVGKSNVAEQIATLMPVNIINGDMGQCYTPLTLGTAKPQWRESSIPHYLFDCIHEPRDFTVVEYYQLVQKSIAQAWQQGRMPIIVGGSSFYVSSLFFPPQPAVKIHSSLAHEYNEQDLWQQLYAVDPDRAQDIDRRDTYRLKRALDIWHNSGQKPSQYVPIYKPICENFRYLFLVRNRAELHTRINKRVKDMIASGWEDEVRALIGSDWEPFLLRKKIIGYDDIISFLHQEDQSDKEKEKMVHTISKRTRHYAKRQITFWRRLRQSLQKHVPESWLTTTDISNKDINSYAESIVEGIRKEIDI